MWLGGVYLPREMCVENCYTGSLVLSSSGFLSICAREDSEMRKCRSSVRLPVPPPFSFSPFTQPRTRAHLPSARFQMCHALLRITAQQPDYEKRLRAAW